MAKSSIMIDLDDPRSAKIADVMSNKTSKKVLALLAEGEMSSSELAAELKMPLNTVGYNLKKLVDAGLIEKSKKFFWSTKGKRIEFYKISNRRIIISPKSMIKGVLPAVLVSGVLAFGIKFWTSTQFKAVSTATDLAGAESDMPRALAESGASAVASASERALDASVQKVATAAPEIVSIAQNAWLWFLAGALAGLFIYLLWNYRGQKWS